MKKSFVLKKGAIVLSALAVTAGVTVPSAAFANEVQPQQLPQAVESVEAASSEYDYVHSWEEADSTRRPSYPFYNFRPGTVKFEIQQYSVNNSYTDVSYVIRKNGKEVTSFDVEGNYTGANSYHKDIYLEDGSYDIQVINFSRTDGPGEGDYALGTGQIKIKVQW
ncbi:hypothetical protein AM501_12735 [Aneurinibacillus migulanus]|uniref:hypothetical protein n=1 Tax=Aneurinibacillus migulanus TaxID=47500 RepID=UPI0005BB1699|nr:hypothetical protein [Aneurinibacillus migulanus]KIV56097.1 hypothetical protein TS64_11540 [Aneurinibacillus migulanus]KPD07929.1 hypothetical protein AM501_12735 [Aneurinibacillus migulanus]